MFVHGLRHIWRAVEQGALFLSNQPHGLFRFKRFLQNDAASVRQDVHQGIDAAKPPEQRNGQPESITGNDMLALTNLPRVGN
ncbi:hypothetical protein D3C85_1261390 [compost metagenome]